MSGLPLVTGATGFAGSHLVDLLLEQADAPAATEPVITAWGNPNGAPITARHPAVAWQAVDVLDRSSVRDAIVALQPSVIYHCAGAADVGTSFTNPLTPLRVNALGTHHVLDAVRVAGLTTPVVVTGSATVYRASMDALDEDASIGPSSPYGVSKLAQEMLAFAVKTFPVLVARPFNHAGPRQGSAYVTSSFARQIAEIEAGLKSPVLSVGNLDARRDITDVRDTVRAYALLAAKGRPSRPYNVCSGRAYRIGDLLELLLGRARVRVAVASDPARMRPSDNPVLLGDPQRARRELGWQASIAIEDTLSDLLDYWRQHVAAARA